MQQIKLERHHVQANKSDSRFLIPKSETGSILILIEQNAVNSFFSAGLRKFEAKVGMVYYLDAQTDIYFNVESKSIDNIVLLAYRAYTDIKQ